MSLFAVHREAGATWVDNCGAFEQPEASDHATFMAELADEGLIQFAGPLAGSANGRIRVLLIAEAPDEKTIIERLSADPWEMTDRIVTTTIEPWTLLVGTIDGSEH